MFPLTTQDHTDAREQDFIENHESLATAAPHHVPWLATEARSRFIPG